MKIKKSVSQVVNTQILELLEECCDCEISAGAKNECPYCLSKAFHTAVKAVVDNLLEVHISTKAINPTLHSGFIAGIKAYKKIIHNRLTKILKELS